MRSGTSEGMERRAWRIASSSIALLVVSATPSAAQQESETNQPHPPGPGLPSEDPSVATVRRGREGRGETGRSAELGESRREMPASSSSADGSTSSPSSGRREPDPGAGVVGSQGRGGREGPEEGRTAARPKSESTPTSGAALPLRLAGRDLAESLEKDSANWPSVKSAGSSVKSAGSSVKSVGSSVK